MLFLASGLWSLSCAKAQPGVPAPPRAPSASTKTGDELQHLIDGAADGATVWLSGTYSAPAGTTYVVSRRLNLAGKPATLINIRLVFLADAGISNLSFVENDCTFHAYAPTACSPATPLITLGMPGSTIQSASIENVSLTYGRAYTGIAFGMGSAQNVTIDHFTIVDNEMSAITGLGGNHIVISNGRITGGAQQNVDDGVALYSVYGPLTDVTVTNVQAQDAFDLVGIGALMYYPISNIQVSNSQCTRTAVCLYIKSGNSAPVPAGFSGYSQLSQVHISDITDTDTGGSRYLSSIWVTGVGGAAASGITIDHVTATSWASGPANARIKIFTDQTSTLKGIVLSNLTFGNPSSKGGYEVAEGMFVQDLGSHNISDVTLTGDSIDGMAYYAVDSSTAQVNGLSIDSSTFSHVNQTNSGAPMFVIPYAYRLNGTMVLQ